MKVIEAADYEDLSRQTAEIVIAQLRAKPSSLLVFPTGRTPLGLFKALVDAERAGRVDFSAAVFLTLDEYASIAADDRRRLLLWLKLELLGPLRIPDSAVHAFDPLAEPHAEADRIEALIAERGGIDLAIVGLGPNGHIGMNEPGSAFDSRTRRVDLTPATIRSNAAYWGTEADVPRAGLTLGLGTLGEAGKLVLITGGAEKAGILAKALNDPISEDLPATALRLHSNGIVVADRAAMGQATRLPN